MSAAVAKHLPAKGRSRHSYLRGFQCLAVRIASGRGCATWGQEPIHQHQGNAAALEGLIRLLTQLCPNDCRHHGHTAREVGDRWRIAKPGPNQRDGAVSGVAAYWILACA
jgi:hypothetical protein